MTSVPPTQPPAAPETDVRLTEAERDYFCGNLRQNLGYRAYVIEDTMLGHVERIVAERVRVVEGERDAARVSTCDLDHGWDDNPARVYGHYGSPRTCIRLRATDEWVYDPAWEDAR